MNTEIMIHSESCISCGKCAAVCPSMVFISAKGKVPTVVNPDDCIGCGHCVAVCPSASVRHSLFPPTTVHPIDYALYPSPEQMMLLCRGRRSNRAFTTKSISDDFLNQIIEAAYRAPTASNSQNLGFTLVTSPEKLREVSEFTIGVFDKLVKVLTNPFVKPFMKRIMPDVYKYEQAFLRMKEEFAGGNDLILRGATALLLIHAPAKSRFAAEDGNLAYQNGSLMAESLGVSQFYTGFVLTAIRQDGKQSLERMLGIDGKICAGLALGMPSFRYPNYIDRKEIRVNRI